MVGHVILRPRASVRTVGSSKKRRTHSSKKRRTHLGTYYPKDRRLFTSTPSISQVLPYMSKWVYRTSGTFHVLRYSLGWFTVSDTGVFKSRDLSSSYVCLYGDRVRSSIVHRLRLSVSRNPTLYTVDQVPLGNTGESPSLLILLSYSVLTSFNPTVTSYRPSPTPILCRFRFGVCTVILFSVFKKV